MLDVPVGYVFANLPIVIVVPPMLVQQWLKAFRQWCEPGSVNVYEYTGAFKKETRQAWWEKLYSVRDKRKVIITTNSVRILWICCEIMR